MKDLEISFNSTSPLYNFFDFVLMVKTVPVATEYTSSKTGSPASLRTTLPSASTCFFQFCKSIPIPPVTSTVVKKIGEIPLVPATIGAMFTNGM